MPKKRTWSGQHHWVPRANWTTPLEKELFDDFTTDLEHQEHVQTHRDEREVGPIGSIARYDMRRWMENFEDFDPFS